MECLRCFVVCKFYLMSFLNVFIWVVRGWYFKLYVMIVFFILKLMFLLFVLLLFECFYGVSVGILKRIVVV